MTRWFIEGFTLRVTSTSTCDRREYNDLTLTSLSPPGAYKTAVGLKQVNPNLKVLIAIGGWNEGGKKYSDMAATKMSRDKFVQSVVTFLQEHQFDGLDLDWEYPGK